VAGRDTRGAIAITVVIIVVIIIMAIYGYYSGSWESID
jgi:hypothetical protein